MNKVIDKDKALSQVLADIEKQFGKGAIMKLGGQNNIEIDTIKDEINLENCTYEEEK